MSPRGASSKLKALTLYFDDLTLGQRFAHPGRPAMERERILQFAAEFDPQPFHVDAAAAVTARLLIESVPLAGGLVGLGVEVSWPRPTRPGDRLAVATEVAALARSRSKPDRGVVTLRTETTNQDGETLQVMTAKFLVPCRP